MIGYSEAHLLSAFIVDELVASAATLTRRSLIEVVLVDILSRKLPM